MASNGSKSRALVALHSLLLRVLCLSSLVRSAFTQATFPFTTSCAASSYALQASPFRLLPTSTTALDPITTNFCFRLVAQLPFPSLTTDQISCQRLLNQGLDTIFLTTGTNCSGTVRRVSWNGVSLGNWRVFLFSQPTAALLKIWHLALSPANALGGELCVQAQAPCNAPPAFASSSAGVVQYSLSDLTHHCCPVDTTASALSSPITIALNQQCGGTGACCKQGGTCNPMGGDCRNGLWLGYQCATGTQCVADNVYFWACRAQAVASPSPPSPPPSPLSLTSPRPSPPPSPQTAGTSPSLSPISPTTYGKLGVNYGSYNYGMPAATALTILRGRGVRMLRTFNHDAAWLATLLNVYGTTPVSATIAVPNNELVLAATSPAFINSLMATITTYINIVTMIDIGNEPWAAGTRAGTMPYLVAAYTNVLNALKALGYDTRVKVTIPWSAEVLINTYPVANSQFDPAILPTMLSYFPSLTSTNTPFSINLYPYFAGLNDRTIPLPFVLGANGLTDTGSMLVSMIHGTKIALAKAGFPNMNLIIGETGFPSAGNTYTTLANQQAYVGTLRATAIASNINIYLFEAFDEANKGDILPDPAELHYGIMDSSGVPKFPLDISS